MPSRRRPRATKSPSSGSPQEIDDAYEAGAPTLDLDDISDDDLDTLSFEEDSDTTGPSLKTLTGLSLIVAGLIYLFTEVSAQPAPVLSPDMILPWLLGTTVLLLGAGLLMVHSSNDSDAKMPSSPSESSAADANSPQGRLLRSRTDRKLFGVCGGIAAYLGVDPTLVRVGFVLGTVLFGPLLLIYLGLAFAIPKAPTSS